VKDLAWLGLFFLLLGGVELLEDYRAERCTDHGGRWRNESWFEFSRCERPAK
jgi:hypothetical protein